jgi:Aspartyl protease/Tetratricopeptide repeat
MIRLGLSLLATTLVAATSSAGTQNDSAAALFARGDFAAAASAYEAILRTHPSDRNAQLALGTIRLYENDLAAAEPLLDTVLALDPQNPRAMWLMAELERRRAEGARRTRVTGNESVAPFLTADPLPVVRIVANGKAANFLVDTGTDVALEPSFAASIGVRTINGGTGTFVGGQHAAMESGKLQSLALGTATAYEVPVHVFPTHARALFGNLRIDGVVGTTYFERFLVTIDYPHNQLILRPRSPQISAAFETAAAAAHAAIVPFYLVGDHFVIARAQVDDAPEGLFIFDSGLAGGGLMPSAQLVKKARISLDEAHAGTGIGGGGAVTAVPFIAQRVAVGSAVQPNVPGLFTPQGSPFGIFPFTVWGAISNDFLKHYAYSVDFDAMKIVLAPSPLGSAMPQSQPRVSGRRAAKHAENRAKSS